MVAAISLTLDCFPILTRAFENIFSTLFDFLPTFFIFFLENSVGRLLILSLAEERLSRLILTAFRFWLEYRKSILKTFSRLFRTFYLEFSVQYFTLGISGLKKKSWNLCESHYLAHFWLLFLLTRTLVNHFSTLFRLFFPTFKFFKSWK